MVQVGGAAINGYPAKCQEHGSTLTGRTALLVKAHEIHHTMTTAGRSDHHRSVAVNAYGVQCGNQICGVYTTYARQQLMASKDDGPDIVKIKFTQQTEKIHGPGFTGMGAYLCRLGAVVRADEIGVTDKRLASFSPYGMRQAGKPGVLN